MLYEYMKQGFVSEGDWNCAERTLRGANTAYGLGLDDDALRLAGAFGGGMAVEGVCGVVSGAAMALSAMFVEDRAHASEKIKPLTKEFIERFEAELGMSDCARLKAKYRTPEEGCACLILAGAKILDDIVARERG